MRHHNEDFVKFHEKLSVRTVCARKMESKKYFLEG